MSAHEIFAKWKSLAAAGGLPVEVERDVREVIREHETREAGRLMDHLERCEVPQRVLRTLAFEPDETAALKAVREFVAGIGPTQFMLLLLGAPGAGKTVAAASSLEQARKDTHFMGPDGPVRTWSYSAKRGLFVRANQLARDAYSDDGRKLFRRACEVRWLVLDELGAERIDNAGVWLSALDELIGARDASELPTVITSNLSTEAFAQRYGERVVSRIAGVGKVVGCGTVDLRRGGA